MYIGGRAYLEISPSARFYAWEKVVKNKEKKGDKKSPPLERSGGGNGMMNDPNRPLPPQLPASSSVLQPPSVADHLHVTVTVRDSGEWTRRDLTSLICDGTG